MSFFSEKKLLLIGFILVLLTVIPITVYFLQRQQELRTRAERATTLSFTPSSSATAPIQKTVGQTFDLDAMMNPGTNQVIAVRLVLTYDDTKLATASGTCGTSLCHNQTAFSSVLEGPIYTARSGSNPATIAITMTVGIDITKAVQTTTKIATVTFRALSQAAETQVAFLDQTNVTSTSDPEANVLAGRTPATIAIGVGPTPTSAPTAANKPPVCDTLNLDRTPTGAAPLSLAFSVNGSDPDGTVSKVTLDFGDGPAQNIVQGSGIGTSSVTVQVSHTYNNPGTFTAKASLTDNSGATGSGATCTKTITVTQATTTPGVKVTPGVGAPPAATPSATPTPLPPTPTVVPPTPTKGELSPPGPGDAFVGIGLVGLLLTIIAGALFFAL